MAYGIEVFNNNQTFQFGTDTETGLTVITSGSVATNANVSLNTTTQIICVRRANTGFIYGTTTPGSSGNWRNVSGVTVDYIILEKMTFRASNDSGDYGIEIYNSAGVLTFSSKYTRGQAILSVDPPGTLSSTSDTVPGDHPVVYSGDLTGVYYGFGRMVYNLAVTPFIKSECAYFDYTGNLIRSVNITGYPIPGFGTVYVPYPNMSSVITLKRN
jgi:hypothetical protein